MIKSYNQYDWGIIENFYIAVSEALGLKKFNLFKYCNVIKFDNDLEAFTENRDWQINAWKENQGYSLLIGTKRGQKSFVVWKITNSRNQTFLSITVYPHLLNNWPKVFSFLPYLIFIKPILKSYLFSVVNGVNWYSENKKPIEKNYFGKHIWFSKF